MPYTLTKGLGWFLAALVLGIVIGWLLRSVAAKRQVARARAHHVDSAEMERLRGRVANLEPAVAERDRLRAELDQCRGTGSVDVADELEPPAAAGASPAAVGSSPPAPEALAVMTPAAAVVPEMGNGDDGDDGDDGATEPGAVDAAGSSNVAAPHAAVAEVPVAPDVGAAAAVLGHRITLDDLKVVEGIGPKIEGLCHGIGIRTWFDLSTTEVSLLRTMLADAGPRFRTHDPGSWPQQARLLAEGRWEEFRALTESLNDGRSAE